MGEVRPRRARPGDARVHQGAPPEAPLNEARTSGRKRPDNFRATTPESARSSARTRASTRRSAARGSGYPLKFLCDNCKAKYQIADEKVAGKTVRMKCRKCGHQNRGARRGHRDERVDVSAGRARRAARKPRGRWRRAASRRASPRPSRAPMAAQPQAPAASALAGAFQRTVQDAPQSLRQQPAASPIELSVTDEWYVAINGVPVGPVRISELRRKAASGAVTEDSLCWQEGLEEWRPVRSIPELAAIVREAAQGNRPSLVAPPPNEGRGSSPPRAPQPQPPRRASSAPAAPARSPAPPPRTAAPMFDAASAGSGAQQRRSAPCRRVRAPQHRRRAADHRSARRRARRAALAPSFAPHAAPHVRPADAARADAAAGAARDQRSVRGAACTLAPTASLARASGLRAVRSRRWLDRRRRPQKRGVPLWFWPILLFTGVFGVVGRGLRLPAASAAGARRHPDAARRARAPTATTEAKNDVPPPPPSAEPTTAASAPDRQGRRWRPAPQGGGGAAAPPEKKGIDLGGLVPGAGGPNVGGGSGPGAARRRRPRLVVGRARRRVAPRGREAHVLGAWRRGPEVERQRHGERDGRAGRQRRRDLVERRRSGRREVHREPGPELEIQCSRLDHDREHPVQVRPPVTHRTRHARNRCAGRPTGCYVNIMRRLMVLAFAPPSRGARSQRARGPRAPTRSRPSSRRSSCARRRKPRRRSSSPGSAPPTSVASSASTSRSIRARATRARWSRATTTATT